MSDGAQVDDLAVGRLFKDLSITLSGVGNTNQERGREDPSLPCELMVSLINPLLTPPASSYQEELDHRI